MSEFERINKIKAVVFDVDGVFTDGRTWQDARGFWRRRFSVRDTMGIRALRKAGIRAIVLTPASAQEINHHLTFVGVDEFHDNCVDKHAQLSSIAKRLGLSFDEIAFMSENVQDLELLKEVGVGISVPTAASELQNASLFVTGNLGGDGAVLEACGMILRFMRISGQDREEGTTSRTNRRSASF